MLTLLWRQVPSVQELNRLLARENLLWCRATKIAQQSLAERFLVFPAELFERVFKDVLPQLEQNWQQRTQRSLPNSPRVCTEKLKINRRANKSELQSARIPRKVIQALLPLTSP